MRLKLIPHPDQIRWYANAALSGFDTLSPEQAAQVARDSVRGLLEYLDALDATDDASFEEGSVAIKLAGALELRVRNPDRGDLPNLEVA